MNYKKISFDWDNTIAMSYMIDSEGDSELPIYKFQGYNSILIDLIKDYYDQGIELHIVTSRKKSLEEYYPEDSVDYQLKLLKLDHIFPSVRVHFTEGDLKAKTLKQVYKLDKYNKPRTEKKLDKFFKDYTKLETYINKIKSKSATKHSTGGEIVIGKNVDRSLL